MTLTEAEIVGLCKKLANWSCTYMCKARDSANDRELRLVAEKHATESMSPEGGSQVAGEPQPTDDARNAEESHP
jgi:hypothetical protein